jgi:hypothetical protein
MIASLIWVGREAYFVWKLQPPPVKTEASGPALPAPPKAKLHQDGQGEALTLPKSYTIEGRPQAHWKTRMKAPEVAQPDKVRLLTQTPIDADSPALLNGGEGAYGGHAVMGRDPRVVIFWMLAAFAIVYALLALSLRAGILGKRQPLTHE